MSVRTLCAIGAALLLGVTPGAKAAVSADVPYVPTPWNVVETMFDMAKVTAADHLIDLGSGDGRIVIEAGDLRKSSPLRAACEKSKYAAAVACYADTERDLDDRQIRRLEQPPGGSDALFHHEAMRRHAGGTLEAANEAGRAHARDLGHRLPGAARQGRALDRVVRLGPQRHLMRRQRLTRVERILLPVIGVVAQINPGQRAQRQAYPMACPAIGNVNQFEAATAKVANDPRSPRKCTKHARRARLGLFHARKQSRLKADFANARQELRPVCRIARRSRRHQRMVTVPPRFEAGTGSGIRTRE